MTAQAETQFDLWYSADTSDHAGRTIATDCLPFDTLLELSVQRIQAVMADRRVVCIGVSWGKDSTVTLALTLEAARRHLEERGHSPKLVVVTADTGVENPKVSALGRVMSSRMLAWSKHVGLDVTQEWVVPPVQDRYLVRMIGGQAVASVPGSNSQCAVDLKVRPMERFRKKLNRMYGQHNLVTLIGLRFDESVARGQAMRSRGERFDVPYRSAQGDWMMSPIADWSTSDVWRFINTAERLPFPVFSDFTDTIILYEMAGESTCQIGALDPSFSQSKASCGGSRFGCWACAKVSRDNSMEGLLSSSPELEPLARLSRAIKAGHWVPENRIQIGRSIDDRGRVAVAPDIYAPDWTEKLLRWALSIDEQERQWSETTGKQRRFRVITDEELMVIALNWVKYGHHHPTRVFKIIDEIRLTPHPALLPLPTDEELALMERQGNRASMKQKHGNLQLVDSEAIAPAGYIDVASEVTQFDGPDLYVSGTGTRTSHTPIPAGDQFKVDLGDDPDLALWWACTWAADAEKRMTEEQLQASVLGFLVRSGWYQFRTGYQSSLHRYHVYSRAIATSGLRGSLDNPETLISDARFSSRVTEGSAQLDWLEGLADS